MCCWHAYYCHCVLPGSSYTVFAIIFSYHVEVCSAFLHQWSITGDLEATTNRSRGATQESRILMHFITTNRTRGISTVQCSLNNPVHSHNTGGTFFMINIGAMPTQCMHVLGTYSSHFSFLWNRSIRTVPNLASIGDSLGSNARLSLYIRVMKKAGNKIMYTL